MNVIALCHVVTLEIQIQEKQIVVMSVNEVIILRLVNEENSVVGQYLWFYNVFLKWFPSLCSETIFNLKS